MPQKTRNIVTDKNSILHGPKQFDHWSQRFFIWVNRIQQCDLPFKNQSKILAGHPIVTLVQGNLYSKMEIHFLHLATLLNKVYVVHYCLVLLELPLETKVMDPQMLEWSDMASGQFVIWGQPQTNLLTQCSCLLEEPAFWLLLFRIWT